MDGGIGWVAAGAVAAPKESKLHTIWAMLSVR